MGPIDDGTSDAELQALIRRVVKEEAGALGEELRRSVGCPGSLEVEKRLGLLEHRLDLLADQQAEARRASEALVNTSIQLQQEKADAKDVVELLDGVDQRLESKIDGGQVDARLGKLQQYLQRKAAEIEERLDQINEGAMADRFTFVDRSLAKLDCRLQEKADITDVISRVEGLRRRLQQKTGPVGTSSRAGASEQHLAHRGDLQDVEGGQLAMRQGDVAPASAQSTLHQHKVDAMHATKRKLLSITKHIYEQEQSAAAPLSEGEEPHSLALADCLGTDQPGSALRHRAASSGGRTMRHASRRSCSPRVASQSAAAPPQQDGPRLRLHTQRKRNAAGVGEEAGGQREVDVTAGLGWRARCEARAEDGPLGNTTPRRLPRSCATTESPPLASHRAADASGPTPPKLERTPPPKRTSRRPGSPRMWRSKKV